MAKLEQFVLDKVNDVFEYARDLRRYFHIHPELSKYEFNTANKIEEELHSLGLETKRVGETGVYAEIIGTSNDGINKDITLRADIDALPIEESHDCLYKSQTKGVMHACGHDAHAASLLAAAKVLSQNTNLFSGKIRLCFQQGEEIGYGARIFIDNGFIDGSNRTFGIHVASNVNVGDVVIMDGPNNASVDWFKINIKGHAAHVSTPELGADAAYVISQIVVAAQALITRTTSPMDNVLVGIGKINAGTGYNIVAENASCEGTIRAFTPEIRSTTKAKLEALAKSIASIYGCEASFEWADFTSPLINDSNATFEVQNTAKRLFGSDRVITSRKPSLGGDDMAEFIIKVPGVYAYVGTKNDNIFETTVAHHDSKFDIDENALKTSVALYVGYAIDFLNNNIE